MPRRACRAAPRASGSTPCAALVIACAGSGPRPSSPRPPVPRPPCCALTATTSWIACWPCWLTRRSSCRSWWPSPRAGKTWPRPRPRRRSCPRARCQRWRSRDAARCWDSSAPIKPQPAHPATPTPRSPSRPQRCAPMPACSSCFNRSTSAFIWPLPTWCVSCLACPRAAPAAATKAACCCAAWCATRRPARPPNVLLSRRLARPAAGCRWRTTTRCCRVRSGCRSSRWPTRPRLARRGACWRG